MESGDTTKLDKARLNQTTSEEEGEETTNVNMEPESDKSDKSDTESSYTDQSVTFPRVSAVAAGWMLDFMFVSMCHHFKADKPDEFSRSLSIYKGELTHS